MVFIRIIIVSTFASNYGANEKGWGDSLYFDMFFINNMRPGGRAMLHLYKDRTTAG